MTTLIIHPKADIQRDYVLKEIERLLDTKIELTNPPPDLHIIDGSTASSIGIEEVRDFIKSLQYQPYESDLQLGVILYAQNLTKEAQNALLKSLEEPGKQTVFILTTTHERLILPTICSRCRKINIMEDLADNTEKYDISEFLDKDLADRILYVEELLDADKEDKTTITNFLQSLLQHYRRSLLTKTRDHKSSNLPKASQQVKLIVKAIHFISKNANKRLTLENLILQLDR